MEAGNVRVPVSVDLSGLSRGGDGVEKTLAGIGSAADRTRARVDGLTSSAGRTAPSLGRLAGGGNEANRALIELSRVANDAPFGLAGVANNAEGVAMAFRSLKAQTGSAKGALTTLLGSLAGPAGLIFLFNVGASAAIVFGDKIAAAFDRGAQAADAAREAFEDAVGSVIKFEGQAGQVALTSAAQSAALAEGAREIALGIREQIDALRDQQRLANVGAAGSSTLPGAGGRGDRAAFAERAAEIARLEGQLRDYNAVVREANEQTRRFNALARASAAVRASGGEVTAGDTAPRTAAATARAAGAARTLRTETEATASAAERVRVEFAALALVVPGAARETRIMAEGFAGIDRNLRDVDPGPAISGVTALRRETELAVFAAEELAAGFGRAAVSVGSGALAALFGGGPSDRDRREAERDRERVREAFEAGRISAAEMADEIARVDERLADLGASGLTVGSLLSDVFGGLARQLAAAAVQAAVLAAAVSLIPGVGQIGGLRTFGQFLGGALGFAPAASARAAVPAPASSRPQTVHVVFGGPGYANGALSTPVHAVTQAGSAGAAFLRRIGQAP